MLMKRIVFGAFSLAVLAVALAWALAWAFTVQPRTVPADPDEVRYTIVGGFVVYGYPNGEEIGYIW